ncbi:uncharacterized protein G2W53_018033 [Senna tora]|uniref:Uncharacterized protein n=1 Tax=Senna tora TaxID=362788 RepID=A0A834TSC2_9FABA|nr:uncharacterized protein G2W53_018033 [Senna tora]
MSPRIFDELSSTYDVVVRNLGRIVTRMVLRIQETKDIGRRSALGKWFCLAVIVATDVFEGDFLYECRRGFLMNCLLLTMLVFVILAGLVRVFKFS